MLAPSTLTFRGQHYAKGSVLPDDVARGLGLTADDAPTPAEAPPAEPQGGNGAPDADAAGSGMPDAGTPAAGTPDMGALTLKDELKVVIRAVLERRAAAGDQEAAEALAQIADDDVFDAVLTDELGQGSDDDADDDADEADDDADPRGPYTLAPAGGSWFQVLDAAGQEVQKVNGREAADAALVALNAGTADGTAA